ncbi:hypothetical protein GWK47_033296 [Chionoecetes opilio]|uniref:Uncharacterized protein n=1 Tax=Chionoecetes opilio TaxID=41210 RepID=A0A8J5D175_CHIOP|nr:hypothetical protein GWK47_033296 [Chionoecetes opilio]
MSESVGKSVGYQSPRPREGFGGWSGGGADSTQRQGAAGFPPFLPPIEPDPEGAVSALRWTTWARATSRPPRDNQNPPFCCPFWRRSLARRGRFPPFLSVCRFLPQDDGGGGGMVFDGPEPGWRTAGLGLARRCQTPETPKSKGFFPPPWERLENHTRTPSTQGKITASSAKTQNQKIFGGLRDCLPKNQLPFPPFNFVQTSLTSQERGRFPSREDRDHGCKKMGEAGSVGGAKPGLWLGGPLIYA